MPIIDINLYGGKMKRLFLYLTIVALPLLFAGCKKRKTADIKSIMTTEAKGAMSPTTTAISESTLSKDFNKPAETETKKSVTEESESFSEDKSEITYPKLTGSKDDASLNTMISDNAKLGLKSFATSPDSDVKLKYNIKNQSGKRVSIVYTGKSGNNNVIFTNNIDLESDKSIGLSDFVDPLTLANYILSDDVVLENASNAQAAGFAEYKKSLSVDMLKTLIEDADFPLVKKNNINEAFPKVFSYEAGGDIFVAIPVPHELGDYVLVKYSPATK